MSAPPFPLSQPRPGPSRVPPSMCERLALTEALFDGRLGPAECASTARHLKTCPDCRAHLQQLEALREGLQRAVGTPTPLEHQRARLALLRVAADAGTASSPPKRRAPRAVALLAAALVLAPLAAWATVAVRSALPSIAAPSAPASAPVPSALDSGATHASRAAATALPEARVAVELPPNGEAPPHAAAGAGAAISNESSEKRPPSEGASVGKGAQPGPSLPPRAPRDVAHGGVVAPIGAAPRAASSASSASAASLGTATADGASRDFADALHALSDGDFGASAGKLDTFAAIHPDDPRAEEAAYLKAIALERSGRVDEARAAARRYLDRYPDGAHRAQAQRLLLGSSTTPR